eukprot:Cvel_34842.t1-p1 / transcript=Cvel_34842.t1 / gene=Cvel_34842 / organism=Chromera_velia_CCMP2878 / gene_product=hypothetical protein / transcript_product=hypothetical protein / location=Cvel_scaffold6129:290-1382(-) / protein_length=364 / sequence_SO=supercontig / SO=protein_coding / is_pseudo=false
MGGQVASDGGEEFSSSSSSPLSLFVGVVEMGCLLLGCICVFLLNLVYSGRGRRRQEMWNNLSSSILVSAAFVGCFSSILRKRVATDLQHFVDIFMCLTFGCSLLASFLLKPLPPQNSNASAEKKKTRSLKDEAITETVTQDSQLRLPISLAAGAESVTSSPDKPGGEKSAVSFGQEAVSRSADRPVLQRSDSKDTGWLSRSSRMCTPKRIKKRLGKLLSEEIDGGSAEASPGAGLGMQGASEADSDEDSHFENSDDDHQDASASSKGGKSTATAGDTDKEFASMYPEYLKKHFKLSKDETGDASDHGNVALVSQAGERRSSEITKSDLNALGLPPRPEMLMKFLKSRLALTEESLRTALLPLPE